MLTVLARSKFKKIDPQLTAALIAKIVERGCEVTDITPFTGPMKDDDDRIFVEVAIAGRANALVTGNLKDYPQDLGFSVDPPATLLSTLEPPRTRDAGASRIR